MKKDFLTINDLTPAEIEKLLTAAARYKKIRGTENSPKPLTGRTVGMIFNKPSTRTRVSFEVGIYELGGQVVYMFGQETQLSRGEPIAHAARVLSRYLDGLVIRTYSQEELEVMAANADIPVINALTDKFHPCQILSDMLTVTEKLNRLKGLTISWVGDGNNVAHSWILAAAKMEFELRLAVPEGFDPDPAVVEKARSTAKLPIVITRDPKEAVRGSQVINTDVWVSMGQEGQSDDRLQVFRPYQVNAELVAEAEPGAIVMHCLPAHPGEEITEDVVEGPQSVVFDQAENRLHAQKALLEYLITGDLK